MIIIGFAMAYSGCESDGSSKESTDNNEENTSDSSVVQKSSYFNKVGENGTILSADATSWEMVEVIEEGLLVHNPTFSESVRTYNHSDAIEYCENLSSAGYSDFRLTTNNELLAILKTAILSENEMLYFQNYFNDFKANTSSQTGNKWNYYGDVWSSDEASNSYYIYTSVKWDSEDGYSVGTSRDHETDLLKVFCVRSW